MYIMEEVLFNAQDKFFEENYQPYLNSFISQGYSYEQSIELTVEALDEDFQLCHS